MVTPRRLEYVQVRVSNMDRALAFYRLLYGRESSRSRDLATFTFRGGSRLLLVPAAYQYGQAQARIERFGIRVAAFDKAAAGAAVEKLGGTVIAAEGPALRLRDIDGIELDLVPG